MFPESEEIENTIVLRKMRTLQGSSLTRTSLLRWFALSLGLMNPNDERQTIVKILDALFFYNITQGIPAKTSQICERTGLEKKTVLYHLSRMKKMGLVEQRRGRYEIMRDVDGRLSLKGVWRGVEESLNRSEIALSEIQKIYSE